MPYLLITITLLLNDPASLRLAGLAEFDARHYPQAEALIRTALESAHTGNDEYAVALCHSTLGSILQAEMRYPEAEREYREALAMLNRQPERVHATAIVLWDLASDLTSQAQYSEAQATLKHALALVSKNNIDDPGLRAEILNSLGVIQFRAGDMNKAERFFTSAAAYPLPDDAFAGMALWQIVDNVGQVYQIKRQYARAEETYKRALNLAERRRGPEAAVVHESLGSLYTGMGRFADAESQFRQSLSLLERTDAPVEDTALMHTLHQFANNYLVQNQESRALPLLAQAAAIARKQKAGAEMPEVFDILEAYSKALKNSANPSEAEQMQAEVRRIRASMAFTVPVAHLK